MPEELVSSLFQLTVAGHHTTTSLIGNGVAALLQSPGRRDALADDPTAQAGADRGGEA